MIRTSTAFRHAVMTVSTCLTVGGPALAQSFTCPFGKDPACLDYGDKVCGSNEMCVDENAACFESYQCNYEGFTCKSNVTDCVAAHDDLLRAHNTLVTDYNELLVRAEDLAREVEDLKDCIALARTVEDDRYCE
jgi:hypothetical protein